MSASLLFLAGMSEMESTTALEALVMALVRGEGAPTDRRCCRTAESCAADGDVAAAGFGDISLLMKSDISLNLA